MADGSEAVAPGQLRLSLFGKNGRPHQSRGEARIQDERSVLLGGIERVEDAPTSVHFSVAYFADQDDKPLLSPTR